MDDIGISTEGIDDEMGNSDDIKGDKANQGSG